MLATKHKRKTLTANDVLDAMEEMEFESFIEPLKEGLEGLFMSLWYGELNWPFPLFTFT